MTKVGWWVRYIDGDEYGVRQVRHANDISVIVATGPGHSADWNTDKCIRVHPPRDVRTRKVTRAELDEWLKQHGYCVVWCESAEWQVQKVGSTNARFGSFGFGSYGSGKTPASAIIAARKAMKGKP